MDILVLEMYVVSGIPEIIISLYNSSTGVFDSTQILPMAWADVKANGLMATVVAAINTYATSNSFTVGQLRWFGAGTPTGLGSAPQATIGSAVTTLATNYNLATGVLGLANALNTANGAQNDLGTKFNSLVTELQTLGLIS